MSLHDRKQIPGKTNFICINLTTFSVVARIDAGETLGLSLLLRPVPELYHPHRKEFFLNI